MRLLQEVGWVSCWIPHLVGQMFITTLGIVARLVVVTRLVIVEFVDCGEAGNCWEFGECGEPCGGETGGGGERGSRSTLKVKLSTILNKRWRQIHEIKQNRFFYEVFYSWFFAAFYRKELKVGSWVDGWVLPIRIKHFRDFLEIS